MQKLFRVISLILLTEAAAYAYLDPGTGSLILQALAAGAIALSLFWRRCLATIKRLFKKNS